MVIVRFLPRDCFKFSQSIPAVVGRYIPVHLNVKEIGRSGSAKPCCSVIKMFGQSINYVRVSAVFGLMSF